MKWIVSIFMCLSCSVSMAATEATGAYVIQYNLDNIGNGAELLKVMGDTVAYPKGPRTAQLFPECSFNRKSVSFNEDLTANLLVSVRCKKSDENERALRSLEAEWFADPRIRVSATDIPPAPKRKGSITQTYTVWFDLEHTVSQYRVRDLLETINDA